MPKAADPGQLEVKHHCLLIATPTRFLSEDLPGHRGQDKSWESDLA